MRNTSTLQGDFSGWSFGIVLFSGTLLFGPIWQLDFFRRMPGDLVDARLNLVFLENINAYLSGRASSLIDLSFFYPYPYISAFSDNLFGSAPGYLLARLCSLTPEDSFQFWFVLSYFINFTAACYSFRLLSQSRSASAIGAVLFTFGLPISAQVGHAQLQYRFGLALAITYFYLFITKCDWGALLYSCFWLVWQYFCSIYLGFFASLFMVTLLFFFLLQQFYESRVNSKRRQLLALRGFLFQFLSLSFGQKLKLLIGLSIALITLIILFVPYIQVTILYRFSRSWLEVSAMSPRLLSYLLADHSFIWGALSEKLEGIPIRWEQQLFIGLVPFSLLCVGAHLACRSPDERGRLALFVLSIGFLFFLTLNIHDYSFWRLLVGLPLFSAIRALSRIILLFLFPISLLLASAIDLILKNGQINKKYFLVFISLPLLFEICAVQAMTSLKEGWNARSDMEAVRLPVTLPHNPILFFAQRELSFELEELDAMIVAQKKDLPTLNGYSGALPHHFRAQYGDDCAEYPRRILLYLQFIGQDEKSSKYRQLAERVAPIGFVGCNEAWRKEPPMTFTRQALAPEMISQLSLELAPAPLRYLDVSKTNATHLAIKVINNGPDKISALSLIDRPLRLAWRLKDKNGLALTSWAQPRVDNPAGLLPQGYRRDLPGDIPARGGIEILAPIPEEVLKSNKTLEFTLVQEATIWGFSLQDVESLWAQDEGVAPLSVDLTRL